MSNFSLFSPYWKIKNDLCSAFNHYTQKYIDNCRLRITAQVSAYQTLAATARNGLAKDEKPLHAAMESFEPFFFNNLVLVLESLFVHRARAIEKKDGNPVNEVSMLCHSMMDNKNIMTADNTIRFNPAKSVLKYQIGDEIKLDEVGFISISRAFLMK